MQTRIKPHDTLKFLILAGGIIFSSPSAFCADSPPSMPPELMAFSNTQQNRQEVENIIQHQLVNLHDECQSRAFGNGSIHVYMLPTFDSSHQPTHGIWKESWVGNGCGTDRVYNVLMIASDSGTIKRVALLPGTTEADLILQKDGTTYAFMGAGTARRGNPVCQNQTITNTVFIDFEGGPEPDAIPGRPARPWKEEWTVAGCGTTEIIPIHFRPNAKGTAISTISTEIITRNKK